MPIIPIPEGTRRAISEDFEEREGQRYREDSDKKLDRLAKTKMAQLSPDEPLNIPEGRPKWMGSRGYDTPDFTSTAAPTVEPAIDDPNRDYSDLGPSSSEDLSQPLAPEGEQYAGFGTGGPEDGPGGLSEASIIDIRKRLADREASASDSAMRSTLYRSSNPDDVASAIDLAGRAGVNRAQVEANRETYKRADTMRSIEALRSTAPKLRAWLDYNPENLEVAHDDTDNLGWWEQTQKTLGEIGAGVPGALTSGYLKISEGAYGIARIPFDLNDQFVSTVTGQKQVSDPAKFLAGMQAEAKAQSDSFMPESDDATVRGALQGFQSIPASAMATILGIMSGGVTPALATMGGVTGGSEYGTARAQGMSASEAAGYGMGQGLIEAGTEALPMGWLIGDVAKRTPFFEMLARQAVGEGVTEQVATHSQDFLSWAILPENEGKPIAAYLEERGPAAYETLVATLVGSGVQTTIAKGTDMALQAASEGAQARRADQLAKTFEAMAGGAKASKLLTRLPQKYRDVVNTVTKDGPLESVRVQPEAFEELAQSAGVSTEQLAQAFRIDPADINSALSSGEDVVIPSGNYAAALQTAKKEIGVSGETIHAAFAPNMRLRAEDFTAKEQAAMKAVYEEERRAAEEASADTTFSDAADRVREAVRTQLAEAKVFNNEAASTQAQIASEMIITLAERTGQDPEKLWNEVGFKVQTEVGEDVSELSQSQTRPAEPVSDEELTRASEALQPREFEAWKLGREGRSAEDIAVAIGGENADVSPQTVLAWQTAARRKGFALARLHEPTNPKGRPQTAETQRVIDMLAEGKSRDEIVSEVYPDRDAAKAKNLIRQLAHKHKAAIEAKRQPVEELAQPKRGGFTGINLSQDPVIRLYASANLSTFSHEAAHWYLTTLEKLARTEGPHPFVVSQLAAIREWQGKSAEFQIYDETGQITPEGVEVQEAFSESFEAYLREGKAPSTALRQVFTTMKAWLLQTYKQLRDKFFQRDARGNWVPALGRVRVTEADNFQVSQEISDIFDRMLATDEAIAAVRNRLDQDADRMAKALLEKGVITEKAYERTRERLQAAREKATADLQARLMEEYERSQKAWWKDQERQTRRDVASEIDERPEQRAYAWLTGRGWQDTRADHVERAADEALELAQADGYLGSDIIEAREWLNARAKGLDMSDEARAQRAKDQGFKTKAFHETKAAPEQLEEGFDLTRRQASTGDSIMPIGVFTKPGGGSIGIGKTQVPLLLRLGNTRTFEDRAELEAHLRQDPEYAALADRVKTINADYKARTAEAETVWEKMSRTDPDWRAQNDRITAIIKEWETLEATAGEDARVRATEILKAEGLNSITVRKDVGSFSRAVKTTIVFDPKDIRSPDAAFDPDNTDSSRLLAQADGFFSDPVAERYTDFDATDESLRAMRARMIEDGVVPVILLFRTQEGRVIAFMGDNGTNGYHHDAARAALGLGDQKLDHGIYNPRKWPSLSDMDGPDAWYATTGGELGQSAAYEPKSDRPEVVARHLEALFRTTESGTLDEVNAALDALRADAEVRKVELQDIAGKFAGDAVWPNKETGFNVIQRSIDYRWQLRQHVETMEAKNVEPERKKLFGLFQTGGNARTTPPASLPPMRLDLSAVREQYGDEAVEAIPPEVRAYSAQATDADQFLEIARDVRRTLGKKHPKSLWKFLSTSRTIGGGNDKISYRGIRDDGGELIKIIGEKKAAPGLIADGEDAKKVRSYTIEHAAEAAWSEGYFNGPNPPTPAEFLDALRADIDGQAKLYARADMADIQEIADAEAWSAWFDQNGIDINEKDPAVLKTKLEEALSSGAENAIGPDEAAAMLGGVLKTKALPDGNALLQALKAGPQRDKLIREETKRRMIEKHGDIFRDGTIMREAEKFARNEVQTRQDEIELEALGKAAGRQFEASLAKQMARENLRTKQVREVLNYSQWLTLEQRWMKKAVDAATKGDTEKAFDYKRYALINRAMFLEGRKLAEDVEKTVKFAKSFEEKTKRVTVMKAGQEYMDQIDQILEGYEFRKVTQKRERERLSLRDWFAQKQAEFDPLLDTTGMSEDERMAAQQEEIDRSDALAAIQADAQMRNYRSLTVEELLAVRDELDMVFRMAKLAGTVLEQGERRSYKLMIGDVVAGIIAAKPKTLPPESFASYSPKEANKRDRLEFFAELRTPQSLIRRFDGVDNGPLARNTIHKLNTGGAQKQLRMRMEEDRIVALYKAAYGTDITSLRKDKIRIPGIPVPLGKIERLTVALYMGTEISRRRLMDGYGWDMATLQAVVNTLDQTDIDFIKSVWEYTETLYPEAAEAHLDIHGVPLSKQQGVPVVTRFGVIQGNYFPIAYNPHQSSRADQNALREEAQRITGRPGDRKQSGYTKARVQGRVTMPVLLDFTITLPRHVDKIVSDITIQKAILDAGRVVANPDVERAIVERHGRVAYKQLLSAMKDTRNGPEAARSWTQRTLVRMRQGATIVALGLNLGTVLKQLIGVTNSSVRLGGKNAGAIGGLGWLIKGSYRMGFGAQGMQNGLTFISQRSDYMRTRMMTQTQAIADQQRRINDGKVKADAKRIVEVSSMYLTQRVQYLAIDAPLWLGAYEKFIASGVDEATAIQGADQIVIEAQGGGEIYQVSAFQRGGPMQRLFTNFITASIAGWNLTVNRTAETNFRNPGQAAIWALDMAVLMSVPVALTMVVEAFMSPGGGDDEPLEEKYLREQISFLLSPLGLFGQLTSSVSGFGYKGPQGTRAFDEASKVINETFTGMEKLLAGEATMKDATDILRPMNMAAGIWLGYPAGALDKFVRGADALINGETDSPKALVSGPPRN